MSANSRKVSDTISINPTYAPSLPPRDVSPLQHSSSWPLVSESLFEESQWIDDDDELFSPNPSDFLRFPSDPPRNLSTHSQPELRPFTEEPSAASLPSNYSHDNEEGRLDDYSQQEKTKTNSLLDFAIQHPALIAGVVGALVCVAVIVTIISMGIGGVGIIAGAGAIAAGVGANVGLSAAASAIIATASAGVTAGLVSSGLTFFGLKVADSQKPKDNQKEEFLVGLLN